MNYASITKRAIAFVIDYYLMSLIFSLTGFFWAKSLLAFFERILCSFMYLPLCWCFLKGNTLGNHLMNIRVVRINGERVSFGRAIIRCAVLLVTGSLAVVSVPMLYFSKRKQAIHDSAVETVVIDLTEKAEEMDTVVECR